MGHVQAVSVLIVERVSSAKTSRNLVAQEEKKQSCENRKCLGLQTDVVSKNTVDVPVEV